MEEIVEPITSAPGRGYSQGVGPEMRAGLTSKETSLMGKESRGKQNLRPRRKGVGQTSQVVPQGSVLTTRHQF